MAGLSFCSPFFIASLKSVYLRGYQDFRELLALAREKSHKSQLVVTHQDPTMPFKSAFLQAVEEYNGFGSALYSAKLKVDNNDALHLYGLKATWQTGSNMQTETIVLLVRAQHTVAPHISM